MDWGGRLRVFLYCVLLASTAVKWPAVGDTRSHVARPPSALSASRKKEVEVSIPVCPGGDGYFMIERKGEDR